MSTPNYIDQIPDYLAGDLSPDEHTAFEKALAEREDLQQSMVVWEELDEVLAPAPEDKLLENIAKLKTENKDASPKNIWPWLGVPVLLLLTAAAWFLWPEGQKALAPNEPAIPQPLDSLIPETDTESLRLETEKPAKVVKPPETAPPPREIPPAPLQEVDDETEEPAPLIFAANYAPNPLIEEEMMDQLRGGEVTLELTKPTSGARIKAVNGTVDLSFTGILTTNLDQEELSVRILLLSNTKEDYQNANYIAELPATLEGTEDGYSLTAAGSVKLVPGLYYYFIEWEEEETYLKIGILRVEAGN